MSDPTKQVIKTGEVLPVAPAPSNKIQLGAPNQIDTTGLTEQQVQQLRLKYAEGMIALNQKAQELHLRFAHFFRGFQDFISY